MKAVYFSLEHHNFRASLQQFLQEKVLPFADQWERECEIPRFSVEGIGTEGFFGIISPESFWGE